MRVEHLTLRNTQGFRQLDVAFDPNSQVSLFLGEQGAGKTTLLKHLFHGLSWFSARHKDPRSAGIVMPDADIRQGTQQSKISIGVRVSPDIASHPESADNTEIDRQLFEWHLWKTRNNQAAGVSRVDTTQLEALTQAYHNAAQQDPLLSAPLIAYYPAERFLGELNLLSKNNAALLQPVAAYEQSSVSFTNFARLFEWLREVSDIEHAAQVQFLGQLKWPSSPDAPDSAEQDNPSDAVNWQQHILQAQQQLQSRTLSQLNQVIHTAFAEVQALYIQYHPKLELMVRTAEQSLSFNQLPASLKLNLALVADVFRRACLLNPNSAFPNLEAEGVVMVDRIDLQLNPDQTLVLIHHLQQLFPRIQWILSAGHAELIEHGQADDWQFFQLKNGKAHAMRLAPVQKKWQQLYADILSQNSVAPAVDTSPLEPNLDPVEQLWEQIQQLSPEQQHALKLRFGDDLQNQVEDRLQS